MNIMSDNRCGYTVIDTDGNEEPCDRPTTGWRWDQNCGHEDLLDVACAWHENEGGRRMQAAEAKVARVEALAEEWESMPVEAGRRFKYAAQRLRAALKDPNQP